jgi:hypothetical protein
MRVYSSAASLALAFLAVINLGRPATSGEFVPFKGSLEGSHTHTPIPGFPPSAFLDGSGTGNGTHLGQFTYVFPHTVNFLARTATGTYTFTAANGDTVSADFTGQSTLVSPGIVAVVEQATITGGTGRFAGASGSFTVERLVDQIAQTTTGSFVGTISSTGASNR